jgi:hypothetical protein
MVELVALRRVAPRSAAPGRGECRPLNADGVVAARQPPPARKGDALTLIPPDSESGRSGAMDIGYSVAIGPIVNEAWAKNEAVGMLRP